MDRRLFLQVSAPAVIIGVLLFGACLGSAWYIRRLQVDLAEVLPQRLANQKAAQQLELDVRQLRYHSFLYLIDPSPLRERRMQQDHEDFEATLDLSRRSATTTAERQCIDRMAKAYRRYRSELQGRVQSPFRALSQTDLAKLADAHPLSHIIEPSEELMRLNKELMEEGAQENARISLRANLLLILLGFLGPVSGLLMGYGVARGLSRSIYRLGVRVKDMTNRLDQDVASVSLEAGGDICGLDRQLEHVVRRVEEVTARQEQQQRELMRAEQLSALGQLAASVAHEVRNPLMAMKMLVEIPLRSGNHKPLTLDDLRVIHREIARLEHTVQGFLDFARPPAPQRSPCDLREVTAQAIELVKARARQQQVGINADLPESEISAQVDRAQFTTVLVNLFLNALDAMPHGGCLEVRLEASSMGEACLTVADTGAGIAPEVAGRLFTPFASTKPTGTGLGLSISRRIVEDHGGRLTATNREEGGACFSVSLPSRRRVGVAPDDTSRRVRDSCPVITHPRADHADAVSS